MLEIKNLNAGYGKQNVLDGVSVSFDKGKLTSIIGANGCGKSTLLKAMLGILPARQNSVLIDGVPLSSLNRNNIAKKIAYLAQGKSTPDMTVMQMVLHGRFPYLSYPRRYTEKDKNIAYSAMEEVGITSLAEKSLSSLSGGMRQTAYIAMALAQNTDYILLDEPTAYLDIAHQLELMRILRELAEKGRGIVTVMHDIPLALDFSDEIALISDKSTIVKSTPSEISGSPIIAEIFGVEVKRMKDEDKYYYNIPDASIKKKPKS